ncbi:lipoprotein NlpD [Pseudoduganella flava]|uniref:Lipoprotein NlpD n=1 Tax=Pseudoduganella flava TaxID=871742 RepID=A0A562PUK3_9BURK|nr:peptidoglycan DD-metalloendopeptidase family protein [Pseudoduganella flava]QGZ38960.1 peptidoglycan DD-metalloendopeptidase family protein [Pseudoduganella flava]TWI47776.1 lipoprotein NlpD [Pseudoduganella flava]
MTKKRYLALLLPLAVLTACTSTPNQAPVIERPITRHTPQPAPAPAPVQENKDRDGYYTVKKGDTLIRIALDHGQNYRDLVAWNNLANPNDIKVDQVLRVAPPEDAPGVRTAAVVMPPETVKTPPPPKKTEPKGDKKPYTEGAMSDLAKNDKDGDGKPDTPARAEKPVQVASARPSVPAGAAAPSLSAEDREVSWIWPADGKVVGQFDEGKNKGIDIAGRPGQQVLAAGAGKVMYAGSGIRGYGNLVIVKHSNGLLSAYAHNRSILVKEGQTVNKGQTIAEMGDSDSDSVKLHFEIRQQGKPVDPSKFLPNR